MAEQKKQNGGGGRRRRARYLRLEELKTEGEKVYTANCVACHQANGKGIPGTFPALDGIEDRQRAQGRPCRHRHERQDRHGHGGIQAAVGYQIAAVITYERNSWGNTAGDMVQPPKSRRSMASNAISATSRAHVA